VTSIRIFLLLNEITIELLSLWSHIYVYISDRNKDCAGLYIRIAPFLFPYSFPLSVLLIGGTKLFKYLMDLLSSLLLKLLVEESLNSRRDQYANKVLLVSSGEVFSHILLRVYSKEL